MFTRLFTKLLRLVLALLDFSRARSCSIADRDSICSCPAGPIVRLLFGREANCPSSSFRSIEAHMTTGILDTAQVATSRFPLPSASSAEALSTVHKDPPMKVQKFVELCSARRFLDFSRAARPVSTACSTTDFRVPRQNHFGDIVWRTPTSALCAPFSDAQPSQIPFLVGVPHP